jgi:hypothetical protein
VGSFSGQANETPEAIARQRANIVVGIPSHLRPLRFLLAYRPPTPPSKKRARTAGRQCEPISQNRLGGERSRERLGPLDAYIGGRFVILEFWVQAAWAGVILPLLRGPTTRI